MQTIHSPLRRALEAAYQESVQYLETLDERSVAATVDVITLRERLKKTLLNESISPEQVISELIKDVEGGLLGSPGGRFFAWVIGGSVPAALAADWLCSTWDQNAALYACSPAAAIVEEAAAEWLKDLLHIPAHSSFAFVTGCQMAHVTCLAAARHALLAKYDWDVEQNGLYGAPAIRVLTSQQHHGSLERAIRLLGLGQSQLECLSSDTEDRLDPSALERALKAAPSAPTILVLQAGDINIGAFDSFETLIPLAKQHNAWVHIDGAFGLWAAVSPRYEHLLRGAEAADSWATDGHKWLNVPFDCGYAFVVDAEAHRSSMSHRAAYLVHDAIARDEIDWNPDWSRRGRGFATYAALRQLGRQGVARIVEDCCEYAHSLALRIGELPTAELLWEPVINQGLVRFLDQRPGATEADHDQRTEEVIAEILNTGEAFFGGTTWRGRRAMRISVCNWQTSAEHVDRVVDTVASVLHKINVA
jgi:glutamate/tyrosine decarboxylase-like PLP-dependent enzyme